MIMARRSGYLLWAAVGLCVVFLGSVSRSGAELTAKGILLTPQANGQYVVTEIGDMLRPTAVNVHGHVVGYTKTTPYQAFLWTESAGVQLLGAYGTDHASIADGINDGGEVVGESFPRPYSLGRAFLWTPSEGMRDLGTLGGTGAAAESINNDGTVAGTSKLSGSDDLQPFVWTESSGMKWLGSLGGEGYFNVTRDLNNLGQVVGTSASPDGSNHAFLWSEGSGMLDLGKLSPADDHCIGEGINDFGHVVGWSRDFAYADLGDRAFVWTAEHGMRDIGSLGGGQANAYAINNSGAIVGASNTIATSDNWERHAFIWQDGVMMDLNDLIGFELGYRLTGAYGINDLGQIVAFSDPSYIPEPATVLLFGLGGLGLLRRRTLGCRENCEA